VTATAGHSSGDRGPASAQTHHERAHAHGWSAPEPKQLDYWDWTRPPPDGRL